MSIVAESGKNSRKGYEERGAICTSNDDWHISGTDCLSERNGRVMRAGR